MLNICSIDSFKIRIPMYQVSVIDDNLLSKKALAYIDSGAIEKEFKNKSVAYEHNGIKTRFLIECQPINDKGDKVEYLAILINSKVLKANYFQGITKETLRQVYNAIKSYNCVDIEYKHFIQGQCTDIDVKLDVLAEPMQYELMVSDFQKHCKESAKSDKGYRVFNQAKNKGIQFSDRATTSFKTNPYLKVYHKQIELDYNSTEFADAYLQEQDYTNYVRFETTIKNKKHLKALGHTNNTLEYLTNLPNHMLTEALTTAINVHLNRKSSIPKTIQGLKPNEVILLYAVNELMKQGLSFHLIRENMISNIESKETRSRKRAELNKLYEQHIKGNSIDVTTKKLSTIYDIIGWN